MPFRPEDASKIDHIYKSLYIPEALAEQVERLASKNGTSFSKMVVRMIEYCLKDMEQEQK